MGTAAPGLPARANIDRSQVPSHIFKSDEELEKIYSSDGVTWKLTA